MAETKTVRLPNGRVIDNIPADASMADIKAKSIAKGWANESDFPTDPHAAFDFEAAKMVKNVPDSAKQFVKDLTYPFLHPIQTAKAMQSLGQGAIEKVLPSTHNGVDFGSTENEEAIDAVGGFIKDRYGSVNAAKRTLENDPVGFLADASMVLTGGGSALAKTGKASKVAQTTQKVGGAIDPFNIVTNPVRLTAGKLIPKDMPRDMYKSAAKFNTTLDTSHINEMADTALKYNVMPTYKGLEHAKDIVNDIGNRVDDLILKADADGSLIPREVIYQYLDDLMGKYKGKLAGGRKRLRIVNRTADDVDLDLDLADADFFTPSELQRFKRDIYDQAYEKTIDRGRPTTETETLRNIGSGARQGIEDNVKYLDNEGRGVADLNAEQGKILDLLGIKDGLPRKANRIEGRNSIPFPTGANSLGGYAIGSLFGSPEIGTAIGFTSALLDAPKPKARTAIMLHNLQNAGLLDSNTVNTLIRHGLLQSGRATQGLLID